MENPEALCQQADIAEFAVAFGGSFQAAGCVAFVMGMDYIRSSINGEVSNG